VNIVDKVLRNGLFQESNKTETPTRIGVGVPHNLTLFNSSEATEVVCKIFFL